MPRCPNAPPSASTWGQPVQAYQRFFTTDAKRYSYAFKGLSDLQQNPDTGLYRTQAGLAQAMLGKLREIAQLIEQHPDSHPATGAPSPRRN